MLLCDHFVFVHLLKTGGTFVKQTLLRHAPSDWHCRDLDGHPALSDIPLQYRGKPCFGFIRNPWDWYVSAYSYFNKVADDPLFNDISSSGTLGFADTIWRSFEAEPFKSSNTGPMSYFFTQIFGEDCSCEFLRFESLRDDLLRHLQRLGLEVPNSLKRAIQQSVPLNSSPRGDYRTYYDAPLASAISRLDADLISRFGYSF